MIRIHEDFAGYDTTTQMRNDNFCDYYGLDLVLLSIDEGIKGYRDDSLETVKRNASQYEMPLTIVGYDELYGWTMDQVVDTIGKKGNCTYCGVFRRQALDRGAKMLDIKHVVTGHNADDVAETILMNLLRGDLPRLSRSTSIVTGSSSSEVKRSKPLKYAYEKEIVLYAHHKKLDYFSTECIYSPEASERGGYGETHAEQGPERLRLR
ncbi:cytoplasmic tRNA 2-thiolation protein 1 [Purpureocillium lavendulum]|uniref:Cytoplasmic tRNA 2-thiolation protein 1 n=1 Tax=Purpureocillium lavendulum TaxID=1247861 RepID=A0AB34FSV4_9HYPO|nr:cytoplasmic tRNA 2-thiolation protein 1 [Purpureocillium lavendulum]